MGAVTIIDGFLFGGGIISGFAAIAVLTALAAACNAIRRRR